MNEPYGLGALDPNSWLMAAGTDPADDVTISARVRLARNVEGFPFRARMEPHQEEALEEYLGRRIVRASGRNSLRYYSLDEMPEVTRRQLFERHLISIDHLKADSHRGVAFNGVGNVSVMVNEEDHLRLQVLGAGMCLDELYAIVDQLDDSIASEVSYAFHPRFGYLTSCPTNVGTGLRASVMLHLPALVISKHVEKMFNAVSKMSLAARGCYGEGTEPLGDLFQISNQITLGRSPEEVLLELKKAIPKIVDYEREVRRILLVDKPKIVEDKVWRAYGTLAHARSITAEETLQHLSHVRLGVALGLIPNLTMAMVHELLTMTQPAHLGAALKRDLGDEEPIVRATKIREALGGVV